MQIVYLLTQHQNIRFRIGGYDGIPAAAGDDDKHCDWHFSRTIIDVSLCNTNNWTELKRREMV